VLLTDVSAPLCGEMGAARVFGPQKGLVPQEVAAFDAALARWAEVVVRGGFAADPARPGMGAAGGLGFALSAMFGAAPMPGGDAVLDAARFDARARRADLVVTGEGCLDAQTHAGKLVSLVARRARTRGIPVVAVAGRVDGDANTLRETLGLDAIISSAPRAQGAVANSSDSELAAHAEEWLQECVARNARGILAHARFPRSGDFRTLP
jgi:glycerate kinase